MYIFCSLKGNFVTQPYRFTIGKKKKSTIISNLTLKMFYSGYYVSTIRAETALVPASSSS